MDDDAKGRDKRMLTKVARDGRLVLLLLCLFFSALLGVAWRLGTKEPSQGRVLGCWGAAGTKDVVTA
jgi:hypothetical protein